MKLAFGSEIRRNRWGAKLGVCHQTAPAKKARAVLWSGEKAKVSKPNWLEGKEDASLI
jgi:hypothetical protein